jgi:prefoldin alpha subunit
MSTAGDASQQAAIEQRINEMAQQSKVLEAYMNDIISRQITLTRLLEEARSASTTIQSIASDSETESLMPIGIGIFVKTNVPPIKKLLVSLGAGVTVEKGREDALNYIESRIKEYEIAARQLEAQRQEIAMRIEQIQGQLTRMLQSGR